METKVNTKLRQLGQALQALGKPRGMSKRAWMSLAESLAEALAESHQPEVDDGHGGDLSCSYCDLLDLFCASRRHEGR